MKKILFLCTGNYYRSKFAEIYCNHLIKKYDIEDIISYSRGFYIENPLNVGAISEISIDALKNLSVSIPDYIENSALVTTLDFESADIIIAINESEHRGFIKKHFPLWEEKPLYWHVFDKEDIAPNIALAELKDNIDLLMLNLKIK